MRNAESESELQLARGFSFRIAHSAFRIPDSFPIEQSVSRTCAHRARMLPNNTLPQLLSHFWRDGQGGAVASASGERQLAVNRIPGLEVGGF